MARQLRVVVLKPSKYTVDGSVERFRRGFMPNSTVPYLHSMTCAAAQASSIASCSLGSNARSSITPVTTIGSRART